MEVEHIPKVILREDEVWRSRFSPSSLSMHCLQVHLSIANPLHWKRLITKRLARSNTAVVTIYTVIAVFSAYFSIYGISTSLFTATFDGVTVFGSMDVKVAFSISQMLGYDSFFYQEKSSL